MIESCAPRPPAVVHLFSDHGESVYGQKGHYGRSSRTTMSRSRCCCGSRRSTRRSPAHRGARARQCRAAVRARRSAAPGRRPRRARSKVFERSAARSRKPTDRRPALPVRRQALYEEADDPLLNARRTVGGMAREPNCGHALGASRQHARQDEGGGAAFAGAEIDVLYDAESDAPGEPSPGAALGADARRSARLRQSPRPGAGAVARRQEPERSQRPQGARGARAARPRHAIRARALVETDHTGPVAAPVRAAGYRTSYYLPPALLAQGTECDRAEVVQRAVLERRFAAVSYDWRGRQWVERCLGRFLRERRLPVYLWTWSCGQASVMRSSASTRSVRGGMPQRRPYCCRSVRLSTTGGNPVS